jgi:heme A synthase
VIAAALVLYALVSNRLEKTNPVYRWSMIGVVLAGVQIGLGALNVFFDLPPVIRVLHVTVAGLLVASQFYVAILLFNHKKEEKELRIN